MKKYWHRLKSDINMEKITVGDCLKKYKQPDWCNYPNALEGGMGCWSLVFHREKINKKFCRNCDLFMEVKK